MDLSKLNPPQRDAVTHGSGPLLVFAGAGSGKTRVITHRIAQLLARGVPAEAVAALTFTNKAAAEMRGRVGRLVGSARAAKPLTIGTFHSLGLAILRAERQALGFPRGFVIYDAADQLGTIRELLRRVHMGDRRFDAKAIATRISLAKNAFVAPEDYEPAEGDEYDEIAAVLYPRYQEALRAFAAVDFDDLITETVRLLDSDAAVRERWQRKFLHVLVDEFQDTNRAQLLMVKHLVAAHQNLCVVGDDDQSIYAWRGADPTNILEFERMFPGARVVVLEQNYRSTPTILSAANAVIANNARRHGKSLWSERDAGEPVCQVVAPDPAAEAAFVAREIAALVGDGRRYRDIAVLYRSNVQTRLLEEELRSHEIPYAMYGGQQFFERKEVKDVIAYLRVALNARDEISLRRIVNYPSRGIGATTLARLTEWAHLHRSSLYRAMLPGRGPEDVRSNVRGALDSFVAVIAGLRERLGAGEGVCAATRRLIEEIELYDDLRAASPSLSAAQRRIDNVESLLRSLERHERARPGEGALAEYLRLLSLDSGDGDGDRGGDDRVTLTTLHGAKGLEFPVVFVIGMEEELLPHARTLMPQATDVSDPDHVSDVSEERRLAYVGITRAMHVLYLTRAEARRVRGRAIPRTPSRFLLEIPPELVRTRDVAEEASQPVAADELRAFFQSFGD